MPRKTLFAWSLALTFVVLAAYWNHFQNGFHFDDFNTVTQNTFIRDLRNIPRFFVDSSTFSTLPDHHIYRPITSASLALDYWLGGGLKPFFFHLSTFIWFAVQLVLMVFLFRLLMDMADPHPFNAWVALAAVAVYGLHPANAETVNYINQRADLYCTLGTVASLLWFIARPDQRRRGWYLLPAVAAFFAKPPVLIFPFLLAYVFLFEQGGTLAPGEWNQNRKKWIAAIRVTIPAFVLMVAAAILAWIMTPRTFNPGGESAWLYRLTQPWIALHYFKSFFLPTELSADTDWGYVTGPFSMDAILGYAFVLALLTVAVRASRKQETRPVAFGIVWFFLALLPTSLVPLAEVTNDHRMFFPFVGLALAVFWAVRVALFRKTARLMRGGSVQVAAAAGLIFALLAAAEGTHERNNVWRTEESLWRDVVEKSPRNGRGLMNYGLIFMQRGDYTTALNYFNRALAFTPQYWSLETNLGVAYAGIHRDAEAENHFLRALSLAHDAADAHYYYGRWLAANGRDVEAMGQMVRTLELNPQSLEARSLLAAVQSRMESAARIKALAPGEAATPEELIEMSDQFYKAGRYEESITTAKKALELRPEYAEAYNNIAAANNALHRWKDGIWAAMQAVRIRPDYQLARNNLAWAMSQRTGSQAK